MSNDISGTGLAPREVEAPRQRSWKRVVTAVLIVTLAGGLAWAAWWWKHPTAFYDAPEAEWSLGGGEPQPTSGLPLHVRMAWPKQTSDGSVTLTKAEPNILMLSFE